MSKRKRAIAVGSSGLLAAVVAIGIQLGSSTSASGSPTSTQTIDAKANPAAAAQALSACAGPAQCTFTPSGDPKVALTPPRVLGDALYDCGAAEAEDIVSISDERSQSTSLEESLSVKVSAEILEVAKVAVEAEVNSKQLDEVATKTTQTHEVSVEPGEIGWTETQVPTATLTGTYSISSGGNQINVTNVDVSFPGFGKPTDTSLNVISFTSRHAKMTAQDVKDRCSVLPPLNPSKASSGALGGIGSASSDSLVICAAGRGCAQRRTVTGIGQSIPRGANVSLVRGTVVYASGKGGSVLRAQRPVPRGHYALLLSGPQGASMSGVTVS
jgi:hypothetical protein